MMKAEEMLAHARVAKENGSTRFCMGSAWREVGEKKAFKRIVSTIKEVKGMGMEVCCTLGMLNEEQAHILKEAGLTAYNHNLDTSREYYEKIITTRTYDDRLQTLSNVRKAGISVCCGGIIGMGDSHKDRVGLLHTLATLPEHPESVPINNLVAVKGTPVGDLNPESATVWDMIRMIATARIIMPSSMVRLSAGRLEFSQAEQAMMFMAGANSIFTGNTLLTTSNPEFVADKEMFEILGLRGKPAQLNDKDVEDERNLVKKAQRGIMVEHTKANQSL
jgi:biotin synthase